jgi:cell division protein FtsZ
MGGTGTGAAPVIAQLAKKRILTCRYTLPFLLFEGKVRQSKLIGIEKLRKHRFLLSSIIIN